MAKFHTYVNGRTSVHEARRSSYPAFCRPQLRVLFPLAAEMHPVCDRQFFASPFAASRTAYRGCREKGGRMRDETLAVSSPQSGLSCRNREKRAKVASLAETKAGFSLQCRLTGGARRIRTFSPLLNLQLRTFAYL